MSRPSTAGSTALPGRRSPGVKGALFRLEQKVGEHEGILQVLTKQEDAAADDTKDIFAQMKMKLILPLKKFLMVNSVKLKIY